MQGVTFSEKSKLFKGMMLLRRANSFPYNNFFDKKNVKTSILEWFYLMARLPYANYRTWIKKTETVYTYDPDL